MSSTNNQGKRSSSESTHDVEPKTEMFKSLKARVFSLKQKNPLSSENQVISDNYGKVLMKYQKSPEKKFGFLYSGQNVKMDGSNSNFSFENEERLDNFYLTENPLHNSFEIIGHVSQAVVNSVKKTISQLVEKVGVNKENIRHHQSSTPILKRSQNEEIENLEGEIIQIIDQESIFLRTEISCLKDKLIRQDIDINELKTKHSDEILERNTKINFLENDLKKLKIHILRKKFKDLEQQLIDSNMMTSNLTAQNIELQNEIELLGSKKKCPLDKICKSDGNKNEKYMTHQVLSSCPEIEEFENLKRNYELMVGEIERLKKMHIDERVFFISIIENLDFQLEKLQKENQNLNEKIFVFYEKLSNLEDEKISLIEKIKLIESSTTLIEETQKEKEKMLYEEIKNLKTEKNQFKIILKIDNDQKEIMIEGEKNDDKNQQNLEKIKSDYTIQLQNKENILNKIRSDFECQAQIKDSLLKKSLEENNETKREIIQKSSRLEEIESLNEEYRKQMQNENQILSEQLEREKKQHELNIKQPNDIITDLKIEGENNDQLTFSIRNLKLEIEKTKKENSDLKTNLKTTESLSELFSGLQRKQIESFTSEAKKK
ncbi:unnamed protein product [Brachionus calyciflorus]|uniref:Uncharacterized protein n=1 Tax=Brachionus calyciflorus TaxID=104777 RepID=A0A814EJP4_9BILA|nr:unnamed protein product [Brachionus calyciflorus]